MAVKLRLICLTDGINSFRAETRIFNVGFGLFSLFYSKGMLISGYCALYFLTKASIAKNITTEPNAGSTVGKVKPMGVKLRNNPTRAVTAKLNPMEKVILSIMSSAASLGNRVSVRQ